MHVWMPEGRCAPRRRSWYNDPIHPATAHRDRTYMGLLMKAFFSIVCATHGVIHESACVNNYLLHALVYVSPLQEYYIRETHSRASSKKKNEEAELAESLVGGTDNGLIDPSTHSTSSKFPRISRAPSYTVHTRNCGRTCLFLSTTRSRTMVRFGPFF